MQVELPSYQPDVTGAGETDGVTRAGRPGSPMPSPAATSSVATGGGAVLPAAPVLAWMDPTLGGATALGSPGQYLPALASLHQELASRQDPVAQFGSAAIWEELVNHAVLNGHLNSLIS